MQGQSKGGFFVKQLHWAFSWMHRFLSVFVKNLFEWLKNVLDVVFFFIELMLHQCQYRSTNAGKLI